MKQIVILISILSSIFLPNKKLFAQNSIDQLAVANYETQVIPTVKIGSNISEDQLKLSIVRCQVDFVHGSMIKVDSYNDGNRFRAAVGVGGLIICASSLLMGTISAIDGGLNSKDAKIWYSIGIGSGAIALIAIHKERRK